MNYDRHVALAIRMIGNYGQAVKFEKQTEVTPDPTQPWKTAEANPGNPQQYDTKILFLRPSGGLARSLFHLLKGTDAPSGAPRGLMAVSSAFTPQLTDRVIRNGSTLVIANINVVDPGGVPILYDIEFS